MSSCRMRTKLLAIACVLVWCGLGSVAWACPNCGEAMAGDPAQAGLVRGIFWSILFLLSMPFLILGGIGTYFYWLVQSAKRAAPDAAAAPPFASLPVESCDREELVESSSR